MSQAPKTISLRELITKPVESAPFLIDEGILNVGSILVIGGPPKSYKSFILNTIIQHLINATPLFGAHSRRHGREVSRFTCPRPCRVLLLEQEIGEYDLKNRFGEQLKLIGEKEREALLSNLYIHSCDHMLQLDNQVGVNTIDAVIASVKPDVVIFDPLIEFHTADENDTQSMTRILRNIDFLREKHKFTTILSHHTRKPSDQFGGTTPGTPDRLRGNSALYGKGDAFLMLSVVNRNSGIVRINATLRRAKPIKDFYVRLNRKTLQFEFEDFHSTENEKKHKATEVVGDDEW